MTAAMAADGCLKELRWVHSMGHCPWDARTCE